MILFRKRDYTMVGGGIKYDLTLKCYCRKKELSWDV